MWPEWWPGLGDGNETSLAQEPLLNPGTDLGLGFGDVLQLVRIQDVAAVLFCLLLVQYPSSTRRTDRGDVGRKGGRGVGGWRVADTSFAARIPWWPVMVVAGANHVLVRRCR
jgi:hypothetical protein